MTKGYDAIIRIGEGNSTNVKVYINQDIRSIVDADYVEMPEEEQEKFFGDLKRKLNRIGKENQNATSEFDKLNDLPWSINRGR